MIIVNKDYERILKIREERLLMLREVKTSLLKNRDKEDKLLGDILRVLNYDGDSLKKITSYFNAKQLIASLVEEIANSDNLEDIVKIRKKLNYYISKVKEELNARNIGPVTKESYQNRVNAMRGDISRYVRYLRRANNISEIDSLFNRYSSLNVDEMKRLKKLISMELSYNRRNLYTKKEETVDEEPKEKVVLKEDKKIDVPTSTKSTIVLPTNMNQVEFHEVEDFLKDKIRYYHRQYGVDATLDYTDNKKRNIFNLLKNIPRFHNNKKATERMLAAYTYYFRNNDLLAYMEYLRRRNSIKNNLRYIFSQSKIESESEREIFKHEKCAKWIYDYCKRHDKGITIDKVYAK